MLVDKKNPPWVKCIAVALLLILAVPTMMLRELRVRCCLFCLCSCLWPALQNALLASSLQNELSTPHSGACLRLALCLWQSMS